MNNITLSYNDSIKVNFSNDAWFNATAVAKQFGKEVFEWLNQRETTEYVATLAEYLNPNSGFVQEFKEISKLDSTSAASRAKLLKLVKKTGLVSTKQGSIENGGGSWFHPKLAVPFARWLEIGFSIWCDMQIEKILHPLQSIDPPTITKSQQGILFNRVKAISGGDGKMRTELWSRFQNHFKLNSYLNLPSAQFDEALVYLDAKLEEYRDGVEMVYLSSKELEQRIQEGASKALPPPVKEGEMASAANTIDVNLKFPDGLRQIAFKFNTEGFHDGRWFMTLSDGNVIIRMMDQNEMAMTFDKWINYAQQERGYVVIKKADVVHKLLA